MQYLTIWDLILTPIYLIVLIAIAKWQRDKRYPHGHPLRKYFLPGLYVKFGGAIFIALIYQFYYGGGDTFNYFTHAKIINSSFSESVGTWWNLLFRTPLEKDPHLYDYVTQLYWYGDKSSYTVSAVAAFFGIFNGTTYIPIALLFAYFSYTGIWAMYRTFTNIYPKLHKELALAFLFIPSTFVWGSAIFKDTLCMFGLGWMVYTTFRIFVNRDFSVKNLLMLVVSFYFVYLIKLYILLAFIPALSLWLLMTYSHKIKIIAARWFLNILFIGLTITGFFYFTQKFAQELGRYSLDKVAKTAETTRGWIAYTSGEEGSAYSLGELDGTLGGMLKKSPSAIAVTLFRPFLWESKKVIILLSALEAAVFLFFTLKAFFLTRGRLFLLLGKDPNILFCLTFALIFAFAVGISTYNFGSLSRYKIPCLPFFACFLVLALKKPEKASLTFNAR